jgi:hypothetical protein
MEESASYQAFERACESISSLIRCADVFGLHALSLARTTPPDVGLIERIIKEKGVSQLAHSWQWFMKKEEREEFGEKGHLRAVCEHIVFASYVVVEAYLLGKFREYFAHLYTAPDAEKLDGLIKRFSFRDLDETNKHFSRCLGIPLARFNHPQVSTYEEAPWFNPSSCWVGLKQLETYRNQLAHSGRMEGAKLVVLVDAWSAYEFCRRYAQLFECNYNSKIYEGRRVPYEDANT